MSMDYVFVDKDSTGTVNMTENPVGRDDSTEIRLAVYQESSCGGDFDKAIEKLSGSVQGAALSGADIAVFPELFLTGYANVQSREESSKLALTKSSATLVRAGEVAKKNRVAIVLGYIEDGENGSLYNALVVFDSTGGMIHHYRKFHLWGPTERACYDPAPDSDPICVFSFKGWTIGTLICYDVEFPEMVRILALKGADLVIVPTAVAGADNIVPSTIVPTRACENTTYLAYVNYPPSHNVQVGEEDFAGLSCLVCPDGSVQYRATGHGAANATLTLKKDLWDEAKKRNPYLNDRRVVVYRNNDLV